MSRSCSGPHRGDPQRRAKSRWRSPGGRSASTANFSTTSPSRSSTMPRKAAQGAAGLPFADRRHRRHRERRADLRRGQASQELRLARRRRSSAEQASATPSMSPMSSPPGPSAISIQPRRAGSRDRRGAAQSWCARRAAASSSKTSSSGRTVCSPTSRSRPAAPDSGPGPYDFCWPRSAPAPR